MESLAIRFSNAGASDLAIWLEPWAEEFVLSPSSELALEIESDEGEAVEPEFEATENGLAIYAAGGTRVRVVIDGTPEDSASAVITCPGFGLLTAKEFVDVAFGDFPEARPGGSPAPAKRNWFQRLFGIG